MSAASAIRAILTHTQREVCRPSQVPHEQALAADAVQAAALDPPDLVDQISC